MGGFGGTHMVASAEPTSGSTGWVTPPDRRDHFGVCETTFGAGGISLRLDCPYYTSSIPPYTCTY